MSRERPPTPPRVIPDTARGVRMERSGSGMNPRELAHLAKFSGAAFMGWLFASDTPYGSQTKRMPRFIRKGYELSIIDNLNDFYAARPRPWRPRGRDSCRPTRKELLKMRRRARAR